MSVRGQTIAVTGATGFLGGYLVDRLLAAGAIPRAVVRDVAKAAPLAARGVAVAQAELADRAALAEAFRGCDAVIGNAALFTLDWTSAKAFDDANRVGTENVFDACADVGVKRVVQVSSASIYKGPPWGLQDESTPRLTASDAWWMWSYAVSKSLSEEVAWERSKKHGIALTVIRPGGLLGPGDREAVPKFQWFLRTFPLLPAPGLAFPFCHGEDVAAGTVAALGTDVAIGRAYTLGGDPSVTLGDWLRAWREARGGGPWFVPLPGFGLGIRHDNTAAIRDLGYQIRSPLETCRDIEGSKT